jgi:hypothetical protein
VETLLAHRTIDVNVRNGDRQCPSASACFGNSEELVRKTREILALRIVCALVFHARICLFACSPGANLFKTAIRRWVELSFAARNQYGDGLSNLRLKWNENIDPNVEIEMPDGSQTALHFAAFTSQQKVLVSQH